MSGTSSCELFYVLTTTVWHITSSTYHIPNPSLLHALNSAQVLDLYILILALQPPIYSTSLDYKLKTSYVR